MQQSCNKVLQPIPTSRTFLIAEYEYSCTVIAFVHAYLNNACMLNLMTQLQCWVVVHILIKAKIWQLYFGELLHLRNWASMYLDCSV